MKRLARIIAAGTAAACLLTSAGCAAEFGGLHDLPLPGGADLGDHPYRVTAHFDDVLDLVPNAAVKVNDVAVGRVESIELADTDDWQAEVVLLVNGDVDLPADTVANVRQSSLLGEKFVELEAPRHNGDEPRVPLTDGALIPVSRTNRHVEVEEVFGALSLLLNGGGITQLRTINRELNEALTGNEVKIKEFLNHIDHLVSDLDSHRHDITAALDGLNRLSATLAEREDDVRNALNDLTPGLAELRDQRKQLLTMLTSLDELSDVAVNVIDKTRDDLVADLEALAPVLDGLAEAGQSLPRSLEILASFPFTDAVLDGIEGDYLNTLVEIVPADGYAAPTPMLPLPTTATPTAAATDGGDR
ncbi:MCE family protein [Saccharomonospora viridis]|uniref:Virulence factor Mce family protein n=2 Tax=Saccharomonospora viridis TaxID=1852 RepID=C7MY41_SACVD|nr:MCE family protein [Saccharomonospora viridis]ACU95989.1 virulence factor Mce family protein [Saccharomonospora viridis DSM 43017]KHF45513.1 ABC transporter substrate-binding protein [Saccharomonospora viridis]SFP75106.1 phospholipid/cholesterol/gamma-HCH transport system substrate-binding protein [Saccharomonospora viridis]